MRRGCADTDIARLPATVTNLTLSGSAGVTGVARFGHLVRLQQLDVSGVAAITDAVIASLPPSLLELNVLGCEGISPAALAALRSRLPACTIAAGYAPRFRPSVRSHPRT